MTPRHLVLALSVVLVSLAVGCEGAPKTTISVTDLSGAYSMSVDPNAVLTVDYETGFPDFTSASVPSELIGFEPVVEVFSVEYNAVANEFVITAGSAAAPGVIHLPASKVVVMDEDGNETTFKPTGRYSSLEINTQVGASTSALLSTGCERILFLNVSVKFTPNRVEGGLTVANVFNTVASQAETPYVSCSALLTQTGDLIRQGKPETMGLTTFADNDALVLERIATVIGDNVSVTFGGNGPAAVLAPEYANKGMTIAGGKLISLQFSRQ